MKNAVHVAIVLFPILVSTPHFGLALICGLTYMLVIVLSQSVLVLIEGQFPLKYRGLILALCVGIWYSLVSELMRSVDPGMMKALAFAMPMTALAAFLNLLREDKREARSISERIMWSLIQGSVAFFVLVPSAFLRELLGTGRLSLDLSEPLTLFPGLAQRPVLLVILPSGLFLLTALAFLIVKALRHREQSSQEEE